MIKLLSPVLAESHESWTECFGLCYLHWCPGCEQMHLINTEKPNRLGAIWTFDGNLEAPTFNPSINHVGSCHYFIHAGKIEFCADSKHQFAGQTVPMPDFPKDML
jgi:hypothetical protein